MPAPAHLQVTWSGTLAGGEIWSTGVALSDFTGPPATPATLFPAAQALVGMFAARIMPRVGAEASLTRTRLAAIDAQGRTIRTADGAYLHADATDVVAGGGPLGANYAVALVATLSTAFVGSVGRGRMFLPLPILGPLVAGRIDIPTRDVFTTAVRNLLQDINASLQPTLADRFAAVASGGSITKGIPPQVRPITAVRVGRVPDTVRSRRGELDEDYGTLPVAA